MVHKDASLHDHLRLAATGEPATPQKATPLLHTPPQEMPLRSNLAVPITSFIGRGGELAAVRQRLTAARMVTLIGAGGVGKTRLALRVAEEALDDYPDGVWLAELAPLVDATLVPYVVAAAVGVREQAGVSIVQSLKQGLHLRRILLVLDNCEHLAQTCAELAEDLLGACPERDVRTLGLSLRTILRSTGRRFRSISQCAPSVVAQQPGRAIRDTLLEALRGPNLRRRDRDASIANGQQAFAQPG